MASIPPSLEHLSSHCIFIPPASDTPDHEKWEIVSSASTDDDEITVGHKTCKVALRDKDVIVAHGKEIRIANIAREEWKVNNGRLGEYKTLVSAHLDFEALSLVVNPNESLLAVVGKNQVRVVVLPSSGQVGATGGELNVKTIPIDPYLFRSTSSLVITKVLWHPWGESGQSLWILTSDGQLREYDVLHPDDPVQTFSFFPSKQDTSTFSAIDPLAQYATSFSFGPSSSSLALADWSPSFVHVLSANGDLYHMGPILPLRATVPIAWVQALRTLADRAGGSQKVWVDSLWKVIRSIQQQREVSTPKRVGSEALGASSSDVPAGMVRVHPPHLTASGGPAPGDWPAVMRQGPVKYDPAPEDVGEAEVDEDVASDLMVKEVNEQGDVVVAVAWAGGKVDLGLMVEKPNPRWQSAREKRSSEPVLTIIETVLLPTSNDNVEAVASNAPTFRVDPLHRDVIYVQHSFGVDVISARPWLVALGDDGELPPSDVTRLVESSSERTMIGSFVICNMSIGHGLVGLASSYQAASVELDFDVRDGGDGDAMDELSQTMLDDDSLLLLKPMKYEHLVTSVHADAADYKSLARNACPKPLETVSADQLRQIGQIVSQIRKRIQAVRQATQSIQNHLDLCVKEAERQIKLVKQCKEGVEGLADFKAPARVTRMLDRQQSLGERLEKVVRGVLEERKGDLSGAEKQWVQDLEKLREKVEGNAKLPGVASRARMLKQSLVSIKSTSGQPREKPKKAGRIMPGGLPGSEEMAPPKDDDEEDEMLDGLKYALKKRGDEIQQLEKKLEELTMKVGRGTSKDVGNDQEGGKAKVKKEVEGEHVKVEDEQQRVEEEDDAGSEAEVLEGL